VNVEPPVPAGLRTWFVIHFAADMLFGLPLLLFPGWILPLFGWGSYDPLTSRLVGAALMGIGLESLLGRNASAETFRALLNLKLIWASSAVLAIGLGLLDGAPAAAWLFLLIFALFLAVWVYYRLRLGSRRLNS
jgi:hypothetical protein